MSTQPVECLALNRWAKGYPLPDGKINVRLAQSSEYSGPLMRKLTKVEWKREKGTRWLYWHWTPEPREDGIPDCGYSGISENFPSL